MVQILSPPSKERGENEDKLRGKSIFIPPPSLGGRFIHYTQAELKKFIRRNRGIVTSSISKKTSFVLGGVKKKPKNSSMYGNFPLTHEIDINLKRKADELNIKIIGEREFITTFVDSTWFNTSPIVFSHVNP